MTEQERIERRKEKDRQYRLKNRDKLCEYFRNYKPAHRLEAKRAAYWRNRDAYSAKNKENWKNNREALAAYNREQYLKHREKRIAAVKAYRDANIEKVRARDKARYSNSKSHEYLISSKYGLSKDRYEAISAEQNGACSICRRVPNGKPGPAGRLNVDHCHGSGRVRGLLCHRCNRALGLIGDSVENASRLLAYLQQDKDRRYE